MRAPRRCPSAFRPRKRLAGRSDLAAAPPRAGIAAELRPSPGVGADIRPRVSATSSTRPRHPRAWAQASVSAATASGAARCPYGSECFAERARARAHEADIIVTNHALLALDLLAPAAILPEHDAVIVDEAHELADRVTDAATDGLTPAGLRLAERRVAPAGLRGPRARLRRSRVRPVERTGGCRPRPVRAVARGAVRRAAAAADGRGERGRGHPARRRGPGPAAQPPARGIGRRHGGPHTRVVAGRRHLGRGGRARRARAQGRARWTWPGGWQRSFSAAARWSRRRRRLPSAGRST